MMSNPEDKTLSEDVEPVDSLAAEYKHECEEAAVKPTTLPTPRAIPVLVPDNVPHVMPSSTQPPLNGTTSAPVVEVGRKLEPNPAPFGEAGSPPPMVPGQ